MARLIPAGGGGLPVGLPLHLPIASMPKNCVLLDGSPMPAWASKAVKEMYGSTLPDYRGRTPVGTNEGTSRIGEGWGDTPGQAGGADRHILSVNEMPAHNHTMSNSGSHSHSASSSTTGNHAHSVGTSSNSLLTAGNRAVKATDESVNTSRGTSATGNHAHSIYIGNGGNHAHTIYNRGGGTSHNNMQPSIAGRWLMKLR